MKIQKVTQTAHQIGVTTSSGRVFKRSKSGRWVYGILRIPVTDMTQRKIDYAFQNFKNQLKRKV